MHTQNPHNKQGNREYQKNMDLNDAVLHENFCSWDIPGVVTTWTEEQRQQRSLIIDELSKKAELFFGFKDPRTILTLPFWKEVLNPIYIATFRHPYRVAQSLFERNQIPLFKGIELWYQYNFRIYKLVVENKLPLVNFDLNNDIYLLDTKRKIIRLGLKSERVNQAQDFFNPALINQLRFDAASYKPPKKVEKLYRKLETYHAQN